MATEFPMSRAIPYALGGLGLSALENQLLGENLPDPVKNVNLGLGIGTGILASNPKYLPGAISTLPLKQLGLIGVGSMDRFRRQQQSLVDTNLSTAKINQRTARIVGNEAGSRKALAAMFLIPALAAGGGIAYHAWNEYKKRHASKFKNMATEGKPHGKERVRIDIPATAFPKEFYQHFTDAEDSPKAFTRLQKLEEIGGNSDSVNAQPQSRQPMSISPEEMEAAINNARGYMKGASFKLTEDAMEFLTKCAYAEEDKPSALGTIGNFASEMTGIPALVRGVKEVGNSAANLGEGNFRPASRYGLAGLANLGIGALGVRYGLMSPIAWALGRGRLLNVVRRSAAGNSRITDMPWLSKKLYSAHFGNDKITPAISAERATMGLNPSMNRDQLINAAHKTDPMRYDWVNPTSPHKTLTRLITRRVGGPTSLPQSVVDTLRYGANRAVNLAYRGKQLAKRWPTTSLTFGTMPFATRGLDQDREQYESDARELRNYVPNYARNQGYQGMPISSMASGVLQMLGGPDANSPIKQEMWGKPRDPYGQLRAM